MKTLEERQKIKNSLIKTRERRKNQSIKVIEHLARKQFGMSTIFSG